MSNVFNWQDYLAFARELKFETDQPNITFAEAKYRSVISRAYYAVFHLAQDRFKQDYPAVALPNYSLHQFLIDAYGKSQDANRREISIKLERIRSWRIKADYDDTFSYLEKGLKQSLLFADEIIELLATL